MQARSLPDGESLWLVDGMGSGRRLKTRTLVHPSFVGSKKEAGEWSRRGGGLECPRRSSPSFSPPPPSPSASFLSFPIPGARRGAKGGLAPFLPDSDPRVWRSPKTELAATSERLTQRDRVEHDPRHGHSGEEAADAVGREGGHEGRAGARSPHLQVGPDDESLPAKPARQNKPRQGVARRETRQENNETPCGELAWRPAFPEGPGGSGVWRRKLSGVGRKGPTSGVDPSGMQDGF